MAKEIPLDKIADHLRESVRLLVAATTLEAEGRLVLATPVGKTRVLSNSWMSKTPKKGDTDLDGEVSNIVVYAEPVIYGTALPPSWGGEFKTTQGTIPGFPDLIAKELESWAKEYFQKILKR